MSMETSKCAILQIWHQLTSWSPRIFLTNLIPYSALHSAIIHQQKEPFLRILETLSAFPDTASVLNEPNTGSLTPLHLAVLSNRGDFVSELLRHGVDTSLQNGDGDTPLHLAVKAGDFATVKTLLQAPSAPNAINKFNYSSMSPLLLALASGSTELVQLLCAHKASLTQQEGTFGRTPLHAAVEKETKESIISTMIILRAAGDYAGDLTNIQNYRGDSPLHTAANLGYTTLCALLMHYGVRFANLTYLPFLKILFFARLWLIFCNFHL